MPFSRRTMSYPPEFADWFEQALSADLTWTFDEKGPAWNFMHRMNTFRRALVNEVKRDDLERIAPAIVAQYHRLYAEIDLVRLRIEQDDKGAWIVHAGRTRLRGIPQPAIAARDIGKPVTPPSAEEQAAIAASAARLRTLLGLDADAAASPAAQRYKEDGSTE